jgi:hypothetical protein
VADSYTPNTNDIIIIIIAGIAPVITPCACARGKVIGRVVVDLVIVSIKIAISQDLGTGAQ